MVVKLETKVTQTGARHLDMPLQREVRSGACVSDALERECDEYKVASAPFQMSFLLLSTQVVYYSITRGLDTLSLLFNILLSSLHSLAG